MRILYFYFYPGFKAVKREHLRLLKSTGSFFPKNTYPNAPVAPRFSADDLTLLRGILAPPTSVDHVRGWWLYSLDLSAISHTLKLRSSRIHHPSL